MPVTRMLWVRDFLFYFWTYHNFCWVCFAGKMPASNILYNLLWVQEDERRARIVNSAEKDYGIQQGLNPWLQGERPALKPLNCEDLFILRASLFISLNLFTSQFWLNLHHSRRPKQTFVKYASLVYEPEATKLSIFLQQWPQKGGFSLTGCKMWSGNS